MGGAGQAVQAVDTGDGPSRLLHFPDMALYVPAELAEKLVFHSSIRSCDVSTLTSNSFSAGVIYRSALTSVCLRT